MAKHILVVFMLALFTTGVGAEEEYTFVTMWPELPQPWYFDQPSGIALDSSGYVYVADTDNHRIQKFDSNGNFITKWGSYGTGDGEFDSPFGIAVDSSGYVFVADTDNHRIQKFDSSGNFITKWGSFGTGEGEFDSPQGIAVDSSGNVFVADTFNNRIQKFDSSGNFITKWGSFGTGEGEFDSPFGIAVDSSGYVYVADTRNHRIQKFDSNGNFITKWDRAGTGDGEFDAPFDIAVDSSGYVFVADTNNHRIQKFDSNGNFIIKWGSYSTGDGKFSCPYGIAVDSSGNVFVVETSRIQKFDSNGNFITKWGSYGTGDGEFEYPEGIAIDSSGNVFVADTNNYRIQKFDSSGNFVSKWGREGSGDGEFKSPQGIAVDNSGYVYVADTDNDRIQKFDSDGNFITKWGSEGTDDGEFDIPSGIAVDSRGYVYVATWNHRIQKFDSSGNFISKWGCEGMGDGEFEYPEGIAVDSSGNVYVADRINDRIQKFDSYGNFITKWDSAGTSDGAFKFPQGIAIDNSGYVYVADTNNDRIQKFDSDGNFITKWGSEGTDDGEFNLPCGIAVDSSGNVYVADTHNNRIQKFEIHPAGGKDEIAAQITAGADDGFVARTPEYFSADSKALTIGTDLKFDAFLRFPDLKIPANATITKTYISVIPAVTNQAGPMVHISAADAADPTAPTTSSDFYARKRTASSVNWDASSWAAGGSENSTDISSVIQELVDSYDYSAGAPIMIFLDIAEEGAENQYFAAFENAEYDAPKLYVEYSTGESTGGSSDITPPQVAIISPEEGVTYEATTVDLSYLVNEPTRWMGYSLDEAGNITISENRTLENLKNGPHNLTIYAEDMMGNRGLTTVGFWVFAISPTISNVKVSPTHALPGEAINISADVFDSSGVRLVKAFATKGGEGVCTIFMLGPGGTGGFYTGTWRTMISTEGGIYNISISATDTEGNEALAKPCKVEIASVATGSISISSTPSGATIKLETPDGPFIGPTVKAPYTFTNVPVGMSTITLSLDGYLDWSTSVYVIAGETSSVHATLDWLPA